MKKVKNEFPGYSKQEVAAIKKFRATGEFPPDPNPKEKLNFNSTGPRPKSMKMTKAPATKMAAKKAKK